MLGGNESGQDINAAMTEVELIREVPLSSFIPGEDLEWLILEYFVRNGFPETAITFSKSLSIKPNNEDNPNNPNNSNNPSGSSSKKKSSSKAENNNDEDAMDIDEGGDPVVLVTRSGGTGKDKGKAPVNEANESVTHKLSVGQIFSKWQDSFAWNSMDLRILAQKMAGCGHFDELLGVLARVAPFTLKTTNISSSSSSSSSLSNLVAVERQKYENVKKKKGCEFLSMDQILAIIGPFMESPSSLLFSLLSQAYVERVRAGRAEEALAFAQTVLGPIGLSCREWEKELEDYASLLAYNDPMESPVSHLLEIRQRETLAHTVNDQILCHSSETLEKLTFCQGDRFEFLIKQISVVRNAYNEDFGATTNNNNNNNNNSSSSSSNRKTVLPAAITLDPWDFQKWVDDGSA